MINDEYFSPNSMQITFESDLEGNWNAVGQNR